MILVIAAHPDDEVLGCGGAMARAAHRGQRVRTLFLADGTGARGGPDEAVLERRAMAERAAEILGSLPPTFLSFPDNQMDRVARLELAQAIEREARLDPPVEVWTHHPGDLNIDHRLTAEAVLTAFRPQPGCSVRRILAFEVLSATGWAGPALAPFEPDHFVGISAELNTKLRALAAYEPEMRPYPHARSLQTAEHLARLRGSLVGLDAAEAFRTLRSLDP